MRRQSLLACLLLPLLFSLSACDTLGYYGQAVSGQFYILTHRKPLERLIGSDDTPQRLKRKLETVESIRRFAGSSLGLPVDDQFSSYVALDRPYVVWNVFAADEFSVTPRSWCYPVAGCVSYRGYFSANAARAYADSLRRQGLDTWVGGVTAYSTLGWFDDPLLSTVIDRDDYQLAALIFHELAHQVVYVKGETEFNESFATTVEQAGLRRWVAATVSERADADAILAKVRAQNRRQEQFVALVQETVAQLDALYRTRRPDTDKRTGKRAIIDGLRGRYAALKAQWHGYDGYDAWFGGPLNNAQLGTVATYNHLVPAFMALLDACRGDFPCLYGKARELARLDAGARASRLAALLP